MLITYFLKNYNWKNDWSMLYTHFKHAYLGNKTIETQCLIISGWNYDYRLVEVTSLTKYFRYVNEIEVADIDDSWVSTGVDIIKIDLRERD